MASTMKYLVLTPDGKEYGPAEEDLLVQWAETGRIPPGSQIRNSLMKAWKPVTDLRSLDEALEKRHHMSEADKLSDKLSVLVHPKDKQKPTQASQGLHQSGRFEYSPGTSGLRFGAWVLDMLVLVVAGGILWAIACILINGGTNKNDVFRLFTAVYLVTIFFYYTVLLGFTAQTLGQHFWGLMIVRKEGEPVLMGRAFCFTIFYLLFFWSTVIFTFVLPSKRAIQDALSGCRIVRIRVRD